jgi:periplasmic protein TonB
MGYQALLFCPDEKLASVVSQVFSELDFSIDAVHEPFAAVKRLMSQRYDAIVVDSENEQNASLLFKSARNSGSNQSSLAIALVEGQMGVAKAYRIGANLVLTKPINVEQAKGTLRVARGLLRKNSDAAAASSTSAPTPATPARPTPAPSNSFQSASQNAAAIAPPPQPELPEVEADLPVMVAEDKPELVPAPAEPIKITTEDEPIVEAPSTPIPAVPAQKTNPRFATAYGSAAATAPAKEIDSATTLNSIVESRRAEPTIAEPRMSESKIAQTKTAQTRTVQTRTAEPPATLLHATANDVDQAAAPPTFSSLRASDAPSFAALGVEDSEAGGKKKIMIAAVVVFALAALGYVGYEAFSKPAPAARQPASAPQDSTQPALRPMSSPDVPSPAPSAATPDRASAASPTSGPKIAATTPREKPSAGSSNSPPIRIASAAAANSSTDSEPAAKKTDAAPLLVKSNGTRKQPATDDSAPQPPSEVAPSSSSDSSLSNLISSSAPALPKAPLTTIRVSQGVSQGLLIKRVKPEYPQAALAIHAQGAVQIEATVNKEGKVVNPKVLSGDPVLAQAALDAVRQWRYKPYYLDGEPVEIKTQITINFKAN